MNSGALCRAWDVIGCLARREHLVDDMNDTVAGVDISKSDCGIVHHHAVTNSEGDWVAVDGGCCQALSYRRRRNFSGNHVVKQNVGKSGFAFWGIEGGQVNACISERLIGWCKEREWARALQCFKQFSLDHSRDKRVVNARALCGAWDVIGCHARREHLVNDVNHTVAGSDIGCRHRGVIDHHRGPNSEGKWVSIDGLCCHAFSDR